MADQPLTESPSSNQPLTESPSSNQPLTESPSSNQPLTESPSSNQPLASSAINVEMKVEKKFGISSKRTLSKKSFPCTSTDCKKVFTCNYNLKRHMLTVHKINNISENLRIKCLHPTCTAQFVHVTKMLVHLEDEHGVEIQRENLTFKNVDEFYKWKENEQTTNFVYFSKYQGVVTPKDGEFFVLYFKCQRDGSNRAHRSVGHKSKTGRTRGTVKMNMVCPARMMVKVNKNDGSVFVDYIQSHSHPITAEDCRRQPMPSKLREDIERRLAAGMTEDEIMTELTGGSYLPTGKQGDRSMRDRRGDRSSINYGIPVENGVYFINKKRLSTMKRRLKVPIATEPSGVVPGGPPPMKKRKTADDIALDVAVLRGKLKELSEYLDDEAVRETMLPDVNSLLTYLISSCSAAKAGPSVDSLQQPPESVASGSTSVQLQSAPSEQVESSQPVDMNTEEDSEPTVFFSDGKNVIKVAIKRRGKSAPVVTQPSVIPVATTNTSMGAVPVSLEKLEELQAVSSVATSSSGSIIESHSTTSVTAPVMSVLDAQSSVILPSGNENVSVSPTVELVPANDVDTSVEASALVNPNMHEQDESLGVNPGVETAQTIEMIEVIEHYEQQQQPSILYNLPTEGAYVTVCDVDGVSMDDGTADGNVAGAQQEIQANASILLNAIVASNLCPTEQNTS